MTKQELQAILSQLGEVWQIELTPIVLDAYWLALKIYDLIQVKMAAGRILKEYRYAKFPVPAEFVNRIAPEDSSAKAIKGWESAFKALVWWERHGQYQDVALDGERSRLAFKDNVVQQVIDSYFGGWWYFQKESPDDAKGASFFRREFIHAYEVMAGSTTFNPQVENKEKQLKLIGGGSDE